MVGRFWGLLGETEGIFELPLCLIKQVGGLSPLTFTLDVLICCVEDVY